MLFRIVYTVERRGREREGERERDGETDFAKGETIVGRAENSVGSFLRVRYFELWRRKVGDKN